nr:RNA-directed DNA polymerase, eukaryota, reverse transcriptase zinc-binding domain protein [Tanacetum cinerariifolium]
MATYKHNQLKSKSFEETQILFNITMKWIEAFVPIDTELEKGSDKAVEDSEKAEEGSSKRAGSNIEQEDAKRQRLEEGNESADLKRCLEIIHEYDDDDVITKATPLSSKSPIIVDYKIYKEGKKSYFKIIRADVSTAGIQGYYCLLQKLNAAKFKRLQSDQRSVLEAKGTNDEIKKAVWECGTDKAPGPDGFTFGFFRKFWYLVKKDVFDVVRAAEKLGCLVLKPPFTYLGSMVGGDMHRLQSWNDMVDRVKRRLSKWKMKMMSIGGRLTLVKSVLGSMPIFLVSIQSSLRVIKDVHEADGNISMIRKVGVKSCWANIIDEINLLSNKGVNLMKYLKIRLVNGDSTLLWDDPWNVGVILKDRFPRVYALETYCRE